MFKGRKISVQLILSCLLLCIHYTSEGINDDTVKVKKVPNELKLDPFYKKCLFVGSLPIVSSQIVANEALIEAKHIIVQMLSDVKTPGVLEQFKKRSVRIAVMSKDEFTLDIPEHKDLQSKFPETNWNKRARGLGATIERPVTSCGEENLLCYENDWYKGECVLLHEFAHTIHEMALRYIDEKFDKQLHLVYINAISNNLWSDTYAISNEAEYWAEGVQCFFNSNIQAIPSNGIHNFVNTRTELKLYDPQLYDFISKYFKEDDRQIGCYPASRVGGETITDKDMISNYISKKLNHQIFENNTISKKDSIARHERLTLNKFKFIIIAFDADSLFNSEIGDINKLSKNYDKYLTSWVIKIEEMEKYREIFTKNEFNSLNDFIINKSQDTKNIKGFPLILILDNQGKISKAWSGDKRDGLTSEDFYDKIKFGIENELSKR